MSLNGMKGPRNFKIRKRIASLQYMKYIFIAFAVLVSVNSWSQSDRVLFNILASSDSSSMPSLLSRPDSVRTAIFVAATFPSGLMKLNEIQKSTFVSFQTLLAIYSQHKQKQLWEMTRYPGLITVLSTSKAKQEKNVEALLTKYPDKIKIQALDFYKNDYRTLVEMEKIHQDFEMQVEALTGNYPDEFKKAFFLLIHDPEVLSQLMTNMKITATLGEIYRRNPSLMNRLADSLSVELAAEKSLEFEDWKNGINSDTLLQRELKQIAENYAAGEDSSGTADFAGTENIINITAGTTPYPYWAGYPSGMGRNYWAPYPSWYQIGLFWPAHGAIIIYNLPAYAFGWWYFNHPPYADNHPLSSKFFDNQYETHRNFNSGFNKSIHEFREGVR